MVCTVVEELDKADQPMFAQSRTLPVVMNAILGKGISMGRGSAVNPLDADVMILVEFATVALNAMIRARSNL